MSVKTQVIEIVAEQLCEGIENPDIGPGSSFLDDLKADSLDLVELVMAWRFSSGTWLLGALGSSWLAGSILGWPAALATAALVGVGLAWHKRYGRHKVAA